MMLLIGGLDLVGDCIILCMQLKKETSEPTCSEHK